MPAVDWVSGTHQQPVGKGDDGKFYELSADSLGRSSSKQYVWDTDTLAWVAANAAGGTVGGGGSSTTSYDRLIDEVSSSVMYVGDAAPGSATSSAVWRIKKITPTSIRFAGGAATFANVWDNRASLGYP